MSHPFSNRFTNLFILCFSTFSSPSRCRGEKKHTKRVAYRERRVNNNGGRDGRSIDCRQVTRALYIYENIKKKKKKTRNSNAHTYGYTYCVTLRDLIIGKREEEKRKKKKKKEAFRSRTFLVPSIERSDTFK